MEHFTYFRVVYKWEEWIPLKKGGESLSIENQKAILLQYAKEHHFTNPVFFVDDGYSGTNFERPGFQQMLSEMEAGHVKIALSKDLSRLGRNSNSILKAKRRSKLSTLTYLINQAVNADSTSISSMTDWDSSL